MKNKLSEAAEMLDFKGILGGRKVQRIPRKVSQNIAV